MRAMVQFTIIGWRVRRRKLGSGRDREERGGGDEATQSVGEEGWVVRAQLACSIKETSAIHFPSVTLRYREMENT